MSLFKPLVARPLVASVLFAALVFASLFSACQIQPLYNTSASTTTSNSAKIISPDIRENFGSLFIAPQKSRLGQQVRNELIFALGIKNGNKNSNKNGNKNSKYLVELTTHTTTKEHSVLRGVRGATSANIELKVSYKLFLQNNNEKKLLKQASRTVLAGYDLTPQNFANQRAKRDAENRASKTAAQLLKLALAQNFIALNKNNDKNR